MAVGKKPGAAKVDAKKTTSKKPSVKTVAAKKTATKKSVQSSELTIVVPKGGQVIRTFNLTPSLPVDGKATNWLLLDPAQPAKDIDSMRISFSVESSSLEQEFERAIIEINMLQNAADNGFWRFTSNGVAVNPAFSDVHHDVVVEIVNQGLTLIAQVQVIGDSQEEIAFGYLAAFTNTTSGEVTVYESQDPDIKPGRP